MYKNAESFNKMKAGLGKHWVSKYTNFGKYKDRSGAFFFLLPALMSIRNLLMDRRSRNLYNTEA